MIIEHPWVVSPVGKEQHFFDAYFDREFTDRDVSSITAAFHRHRKVRSGVDTSLHARPLDAESAAQRRATSEDLAAPGSWGAIPLRVAP
jgi:hypothetical protein